jgi:hypothetical protein
VIGTKPMIQSAQQLGVSEPDYTMHSDVVPHSHPSYGFCRRCGYIWSRKWLEAITTHAEVAIATCGSRLPGAFLI